MPQPAQLVSPAHKQHMIGIRPGEKLHETMIPADDAHCTVELEDRYVILQSFANAARDAYLHRGGNVVPDGSPIPAMAIRKNWTRTTFRPCLLCPMPGRPEQDNGAGNFGTVPSDSLFRARNST